MNSKNAFLFLILSWGGLTQGLALAQPGTLDSLRQVVQEMVSDSSASTATQRRILSAYLYQAKTSYSQEDIIYAYQQLAALNYNSGDVNQALKFYKLYVLELEELTEFEEFREQQFERNLYENEIRALKEQIAELERENRQLEADTESFYAKNYLIFWGLRIALGIGLVLLIGWLYQQYKKSQQKKITTPEPVSNNQELTSLLQKTKTDLVNLETEMTLADILVEQTVTKVEEYFAANKSLRRKFIITHPKNLTSGAGLYLHTEKNKTLAVLFESVSSGAPGGLLAARIYQQLDDIIKNLEINSPGLVLEQLENRLNNIFPAGIPFAGGISAAAFLYNNAERTITFCGADKDLFAVDNGELQVYAGAEEALLTAGSGKGHENALIAVNKGTNFYFSTRAYWQQEGGHEYKPLGRQSFEKTLVSIYKQPVDEQKQIVNKVFEEWRGGNEQNGDVLVFGFIL